MAESAATTRLVPVVEVWVPRPLPGYKGSWTLANYQYMNIKQAEQDALSFMSEGQIARVRMLNLDTRQYEPFTA
jgi:hypothetical protein